MWSMQCDFYFPENSHFRSEWYWLGWMLLETQLINLLWWGNIFIKFIETKLYLVLILVIFYSKSRIKNSRQFIYSLTLSLFPEYTTFNLQEIRLFWCIRVLERCVVVVVHDYFGEDFVFGRGSLGEHGESSNCCFLLPEWKFLWNRFKNYPPLPRWT